jgi:hypothetical protein
MESPKIIHCLWLDFDKKADGTIDYKLNFFLDRIKELHPQPHWEINFISSYKTCIDDIVDNTWIKTVINNPNIGAAHKSDVLRFYYLYTRGGIWIDLSTFLITSLDDLVNINENGFTCYHVPIDMSQSWMIKPLSSLYDLIPINNYIEILKLTTTQLKPKYFKFNFLAENYFCISQKNHEIPLKVLKMLKDFYTNNDMSTKEKVLIANNEIMLLMLNTLFDNTGVLLNINNQLATIYKEPVHRNGFLNDMFFGGYLFNYLMLSKAIFDFSIKKYGKLNLLPLNQKRNKIIQEHKIIEISSFICKNNYCNDFIINISEGNNINLLSSSYNRLSKWNNNMEKRISWDNTISGNLINKAKTKEQIIEKLINIDILQLKFGSWTRQSKVVNKLILLFRDFEQDGEYNEKAKYKYLKYKHKYLQLKN